MKIKTQRGQAISADTARKFRQQNEKTRQEAMAVDLVAKFNAILEQKGCLPLTMEQCSEGVARAVIEKFQKAGWTASATPHRQEGDAWWFTVTLDP